MIDKNEKLLSVISKLRERVESLTNTNLETVEKENNNLKKKIADKDDLIEMLTEQLKHTKMLFNQLDNS